MARLKAHLLCCFVDSQPAALTDLMQMRASFALRSSLRWYCVIPDGNQVLKFILNLSFDVLLTFWFLFLLCIKHKYAEIAFKRNACHQ